MIALQHRLAAHRRDLTAAGLRGCDGESGGSKVASASAESGERLSRGAEGRSPREQELYRYSGVFLVWEGGVLIPQVSSSCDGAAVCRPLFLVWCWCRWPSSVSVPPYP